MRHMVWIYTDDPGEPRSLLFRVYPKYQWRCGACHQRSRWSESFERVNNEAIAHEDWYNGKA